MLARPLEKPIAASDRALKDQAHGLVLRGELKKALAVITRLVGLHPQDAGLRLQQAQLCKRLEQPIQAVNAWWTAANLLHRDGHDGRARAALTCALELAPHDLNLRHALQSWREQTSPGLSLVRPPAGLSEPEVAEPMVEFDELVTDPCIPVFDEPPPSLCRQTVPGRPARVRAVKSH